MRRGLLICAPYTKTNEEKLKRKHKGSRRFILGILSLCMRQFLPIVAPRTLICASFFIAGGAEHK
jgi:hypothetical protein